MQTILKCHNLTAGYDNFTAVENVSFSLETGDFLSIVGENGSGKSTLIKVFAGLVAPTYGSYSYTDVSAGQLGYMPQINEIQKNFPASVKEVVISGCLGRLGKKFFYTSGHKKLARENMEKLNITSIQNQSFQELSGGQRQRVLLARALCSAQKVLILDEPVTGLDPSATVELYSIISELNNKENITVIMVTHDVHAALHYSSQILQLSKTTVFYGSPDEYEKLDLIPCPYGGHEYV